MLKSIGSPSQPVCYVIKCALQPFAVRIAEVVGFPVVHTAELMIKPTARFAEVILGQISPVNVFIHIRQHLPYISFDYYVCLEFFYIYFLGPSIKGKGG